MKQFHDAKVSNNTSIFRYSKNYGSLTHETRIKDAVNMEHLICLLATVRTLNTSSYCIILRLSFANSISNVLSNRTTLMVRSHLGVLHPKFVYCLVLPFHCFSCFHYLLLQGLHLWSDWQQLDIFSALYGIKIVRPTCYY